MHCPLCQAATGVIDSRARDGNVYRRRRCLACGYRFATWETTRPPSEITEAAELAAILRTLADRLDRLAEPQPSRPKPRLVPAPEEAAA